MKNEYEVRGDITIIHLKSPKYGDMEAVISTSDLDRVNDFPNSWYASYDKCIDGFYIKGNTSRKEGKKKIIRLHRFIMGDKSEMFVDHINHNTLDNRRSNLRYVTNSENKQNLLNCQSNSKSGVRGVHWNKHSEKWRATITLNRKQITIGEFVELKEAELAVVEARKKYMPYSQEAAM